MFDQCTRESLALFCALALAIHPYAAAGAAFGCCFFLTRPGVSNPWQKICAGFFSFGLGYAAGIFLYGGGPPHNEKAMLISAATAALAAVIFTSFYFVVDKGGPLPPWLESILDRTPLYKRRSDTDDSR